MKLDVTAKGEYGVAYFETSSIRTTAIGNTIYYNYMDLLTNFNLANTKSLLAKLGDECKVIKMLNNNGNPAPMRAVTVKGLQMIWALAESGEGQVRKPKKSQPSLAVENKPDTNEEGIPAIAENSDLGEEDMTISEVAQDQDEATEISPITEESSTPIIEDESSHKQVAEVTAPIEESVSNPTTASESSEEESPVVAYDPFGQPLTQEEVDKHNDILDDVDSSIQIKRPSPDTMVVEDSKLELKLPQEEAEDGGGSSQQDVSNNQANEENTPNETIASELGLDDTQSPDPILPDAGIGLGESATIEEEQEKPRLLPPTQSVVIITEDDSGDDYFHSYDIEDDPITIRFPTESKTSYQEKAGAEKETQDEDQELAEDESITESDEDLGRIESLPSTDTVEGVFQWIALMDTAIVRGSQIHLTMKRTTRTHLWMLFANNEWWTPVRSVCAVISSFHRNDEMHNELVAMCEERKPQSYLPLSQQMIQKKSQIARLGLMVYRGVWWLSIKDARMWLDKFPDYPLVEELKAEMMDWTSLPYRNQAIVDSMRETCKDYLILHEEENSTDSIYTAFMRQLKRSAVILEKCHKSGSHH